MKTAAVFLACLVLAQPADELRPPLKVGDVGYLQKTNQGRRVKVLSVIDDKTMLATVYFYAAPGTTSDTKLEAMFKGLDTKHAVDGEWMQIHDKLKVDRTKTKTGRTLFLLTPVEKPK